MLDSLYGMVATGFAVLAGLAGVFFYGRSKGKAKVEQQVERKEAEEVKREAQEYREAVEHRKQVDQDVREAEDAALREELKDWVDYKPGDRE